MNRIAPLLFAAAIVPPAIASSTQTFSTTIQPGQVHEECTKMAKGDTRKYEWKSDAPVDFNIHYHEGKEVFYPVKKDAATKDAGTFRAKIAQEYCWMWTARDKPVKLEGRIEAR